MNIKKTLYSFIAMGCLISAQGYSLGGGPPQYVEVKPNPGLKGQPAAPAPSVREAPQRQNNPRNANTVRAPEVNEVGQSMAKDKAKDGLGDD